MDEFDITRMISSRTAYKHWKGDCVGSGGDTGRKTTHCRICVCVCVHNCRVSSQYLVSNKRSHASRKTVRWCHSAMEQLLGPLGYLTFTTIWQLWDVFPLVSIWLLLSECIRSICWKSTQFTCLTTNIATWSLTGGPSIIFFPPFSPALPAPSLSTACFFFGDETVFWKFAYFLGFTHSLDPGPVYPAWFKTSHFPRTAQFSTLRTEAAGLFRISATLRRLTPFVVFTFTCMRNFRRAVHG